LGKIAVTTTMIESINYFELGDIVVGPIVPGRPRERWQVVGLKTASKPWYLLESVDRSGQFATSGDYAIELDSKANENILGELHE
jgi:hypothetical protein